MGTNGNDGRCRFIGPWARTSTPTVWRAVLVAGLLLISSGCGDNDPAVPTTTPTALPFARTEERAPCAQFNRLRNPYFGDLHIHTRYSADAYIYGTRGDARDAYRFARGEAIAISDAVEAQTRSARIERPLDFAAVTDHAEFFGEVRVCTTGTSSLFDSEICRLLRQTELPSEEGAVTSQWLFLAGVPNPPRSHDFCNTPGIDCDADAVSVWQEIQAAAEEAYDRTAACSFTTFIGYEHTASPGGRHLHRNVIFRNHHVPAFATSYLETARAGVPQGLWTALEEDCIDAATGCDAVIIPHNSNLSGGRQFRDPANSAEAARRRDREPLVEIHQIKGNSECRFDRLAGRGAGTEDELCTFEQEPTAHDFPLEAPPVIGLYPERNLIRNVLKAGLALEQTLGVNPFEMGFIGSTDTHNATGGNTDELSWEGGQAKDDATIEEQLTVRQVRSNPGGLAVVWAEESSRDALFTALRRRETYATSGTRPVVRFFAGNFAGLSCSSPDLIERAYERGVPMGGQIDASQTASGGPHFLVWAAKDPGAPGIVGTDLQRIQIIKGWVDAAGSTHEKVFEVAGSAGGTATVDAQTCAPVGAGFAELCQIWQDPEADPQQRAFYYARVLENPTCRWSTRVCKSAGVDPFSSSCAAQAAAAGTRFATCCLGPSNDAFMDPLIQERAWTSPIWFKPAPSPATANPS